MTYEFNYTFQNMKKINWHHVKTLENNLQSITGNFLSQFCLFSDFSESLLLLFLLVELLKYRGWWRGNIFRMLEGVEVIHKKRSLAYETKYLTSILSIVTHWGQISPRSSLLSNISDTALNVIDLSFLPPIYTNFTK